MQKPDIPHNESARLKALQSLNVLDTPAEERFDRLTRLAKKMFQVPIALVSLIDEDRQWFKSCVGIDVRETPRDISFCGHTILGKEVFVISDTTKDERFSDNPLVVGEPCIRFYAGSPLKALDGSRLGTLCIIDTKPRTLNNEDIEALKDLAELAEHELMAVQLATLDDLTKIYNRRGFIKIAKQRLDECARKDKPASLVFFDLNHFKPINDAFGHAEGDRALITFADHLENIFLESDVFARIGGDEFSVLITDTSIEPAENTIARFLQDIEDYNQEANRGYDISCSYGIVEVDHQLDSSIEDLLGQADALMYKKKLEKAYGVES